MRIISVREDPAMAEKMTEYISACWQGVPIDVYRDCILNSTGAAGPLPQWYALEAEGWMIGCAGLVTNDFISRMDLWPWLCALFIDERYRGRSYGRLLMERAKADARNAGFDHIYLSTHLEGYYEKYGFRYIGDGFHPWDEKSKIYEAKL